MLACVYVCLILSLRDIRPFGGGIKNKKGPIIGHFKLLASMKVRGELYSIYNAHWGIISACMTTQYTGLFPLTGDGVVIGHVAQEAYSFTDAGGKKKRRQIAK